MRRQQDDHEFERQLIYKRLRVRRWLRHPEFGQEQVPEDPNFAAPFPDEDDESQPDPSTASNSRTDAQQQNASPQDQQLPDRAPVIATTVNSHQNTAWVPTRHNLPPEIDRAITEMVALEAERARQSLRDHRQTTEENRERQYQRLADCARVEELMFETRQAGPEIEEYMQWLDNFLANDRRRRGGRDHRQTIVENRGRRYPRLADCARVEESMFETRQAGPGIEEYMQWLDNFLANNRQRRGGPDPED